MLCGAVEACVEGEFACAGESTGPRGPRGGRVEEGREAPYKEGSLGGVLISPRGSWKVRQYVYMRTIMSVGDNESQTWWGAMMKDR